MYWMERMEEELSEYDHEVSGSTGELTKGVVNICLNLLVRFLMNTDADMKILPNQWEVATYHGDRRWEIFDDFDFDSVGEILLIDDRPHGAAIFAEFFRKKGEERFKIGFLVPEKVAETRICTFYVVEEGPPEEISVNEIWEGMKEGVERWYEALLRQDSSPLRQYCERSFSREACPRIPDNI